MNRFIRLAGWIWLPVPWLWRGCFSLGAARMCLAMGWHEFTKR